MEAILGTLLKFAGWKRPTGTGSPIIGDAQILIFTGVRYERDVPPPPKSEFDNKRRKRKRG